MKILKTASYVKLAGEFDFLDNIGSEEEFKAVQEEALNDEIEVFLNSLDPSLDSKQQLSLALNHFIDVEDFINAPEMAQNTARLIKLQLAAQRDALADIEDTMQQEAYDDEYDKATYDAEMGRDTYIGSEDAYGVEDMSPCIDPIDKPRSNGKHKNYQSYDNIENNNYYNDTI